MPFGTPGGMNTNRNRTFALDPVDVVTGECYVERIDFRLPGPIGVEWNTYYSNQFAFDGPLGRNWTHSYNQYLYFTEDVVAYVDGRSRPTVFLEGPAIGGETASPDGSMVLGRDGDASFTLSLPRGLTAAFRRLPEADRARLESLSDRNGRRIAFHYNKESHLHEITDGAGRRLHLSLDDKGRIQSILCSREGSSRTRLVSYRYDGAGNLAGVEDAEGHSRKYEYDGGHQLVKRTVRTGYSFHYRYSENRVVKAWGDDGLYSGEFLYEPENAKTTFTGFDGRRVQYLYDDALRVTEEVDPYGRSSLTQFDANGNVVLKTDRCERATVFTFDGKGNKTAEVRATGDAWTYVYDEHGAAVEVVTPEATTLSEFDDRGNLVREETVGGPVTVNRYDGGGDKIFSRISGAIPESYEYDDYHQLVAVRDPLGNVTHRYEYDLLGNVTGIWDKDGWIRYGYDKMSRLVSASYPDKTSELSTFDGDGNAASFTDRLGRRWEYRVGSYKQLREFVAPDGGSTKYEYSKADELTAVTDPNGNRTEYARDLCDFVTAVRINGELLETYERDGEGRLVSKKGKDGEELARLTFDLLDLPVKRVIQRDGAAGIGVVGNTWRLAGGVAGNSAPGRIRWLGDKRSPRGAGYDRGS